jgi:hypothetical protein
MLITEKIRKLIEHEKSARSIGNRAEAEAFVMKIQDLLLQHKLTMSDVELHADPMGHEGARSDKQRRRAEQWSEILGNAAARACFCEAIGCTGTNGLVFIGRASDRQVAISIWRFLTGLALQLVIDDLPNIRKKSRMHPVRARATYLQGFSMAVAMRLWREQDVAIKASGEAGLIRLDLEKQERDAHKAQALKLKSKSIAVSPIRQSHAFRAGFVRGVQAPLRKQHTLEAPGE